MLSREVIQRIKAATVAIAKWNGEPGTTKHPFSIIGSGFCVDPCGIVVTCRHVVDVFMERPTLEQIKNPTGEKLPGGGEVLQPVKQQDMYAVFYKALSDTQLGVVLSHVTHLIARTDHDLALAKVNNSDGRAFPTVELAQPEEVSEGDEVGTCGFPLGEHLHDSFGTVTSSFTKGIVSSVIPGPGIPRHLIRAFQLDLGATNGNSGGPVFQWDSGKVFGALEGGTAHLIKAAAVHHVLDSETLEALRSSQIGSLPMPRK